MELRYPMKNPDDIYLQLKQPATQVISAFNMLMIGFSCLTFLFGLDISDTPIYLMVSTGISIIICILGFIPLLIPYKPKNTHDFLIKIRFYAILTMISFFNSPFIFYNLYFFIAAQNGYNLFVYWLIGVITLFVSNLGAVFSVWSLFLKNDYFRTNDIGSAVLLKIILSKGFQFSSYIIVVQKIIEFIIIPHFLYNEVILIIVLLMAIIANCIPTFVIMLYLFANMAYQDKYM